MATGTLNLSTTVNLSNNTETYLILGDLTYPNNGTYSRHKPSIDRTNKADYYLSWANESSFTQYKWDNWDSNESHIKNSSSASYEGKAILKIKNRTGSYQSNVTVSLAIEYTYVDSHSVTVNAGTGGTATTSAASASPGTTITITCSPNTGYSANTPTATGITFTSAGTNKWTFSMPSSNVTVSCTFSKISYTVSKTEGTGGSGSLSKTSANYGDTITVTASPSTGYSANTPTASGITFTSAGTNKWTFTMPASNVTVAFTFTQLSYSVTVGVSPSGSGTLTRDKTTAHYGDTVTLTRTAGTGWQFSSWTTTPSNLSINSSTLKFTMPAQNVSITANFTKISYNVTKTDGTGGSSSLSKTSANYGDTVTVTLSPSAGYTANTPTASGITFTADGTNKWKFTMPAAAVAISCTFTAITYTITKSASPSGAGTVTTGANSGTVGQQVTVSQTPATGYYFNGWTITPSSVTVSSGKITMPASNVTIVANYLKRSTATLSSNSMTGNGTVTLNIVADKTTYSHKYKLSFGTNMETSLTTVSAGTTSVTISVPDGWSNYIPSATSKSGGTLLLETYNGSTKIGEYTITGLTYNVRSNAVPSIGTITTSIIRTVSGTTYANVGNVYVQKKCAVRIQTTGSGVLSSTVSKMETSISGYTADAYKNTVNSASVDFTSGLLTVSGTATITVKVTDSRGRTATKTATITVSAYNSPSGSLTVQRVDSSRNVDPLGTYATYSLSKSYTAVGSNSLSWSITSQNSTASSPAASGDLLPSSRQTFSQTSEYTIRLTLQDSFETVHIDVKLPTARFFLYCNAAGDRIGIMGATNESLDKNGKSTVTQFSGDTQLYYGNTKFENYFALNSQITNVVVSSFSSLSALGTVLDGMLTSMQSGGTKNFQISAQAGVTSPFVGDTTYFGTIYKSGSNTTFSHVVFRSASQSIEIIGRRNAYGWGSWDQIASASQTEIVVPTFTNESSVGTSNLAVRSVGHIVLLNGYYTFTNAPTSNVQIATLGNHLPILTVRTMCALASGAYLPPDKLAYFTVDANGAISVTPPSNNTNKVMYVSCSWVSNA